MANIKAIIWNIMRDLEMQDFKHFKWFLKQSNVVEGFPGIPAAWLEEAERHSTVDLMIQKYKEPGALTVTLAILKEIDRNDLRQVLSNEWSRLREPGNDSGVPPSDDYEAQKAELAAAAELLITEKQKKIREITRLAERSSKSADRNIADSKKMFAVFQQHVERSLSDLIETINNHRETTQKQADERVQELQKEIAELKRRSSYIQRINPEDFHQNVSFLNDLVTTKTGTEVDISPPSYGRSVGSAVNQLEEKFSQEKEKLIAKAKLNRVRDFHKDVTLDPQTANPFLILSDDGKQVHCGNVKQHLPDNPQRFNTACNVLGRESFSSGRLYFEVEVGGKTAWDLGVVSESIDRKGSVDAKPENGYWTMGLRNGEKYLASAASISMKRRPSKVGVYVDYKGSVSFYNVDSAELIHSYTNCAFKEKLIPFFSPGIHHGGENTAPLVIVPVDYDH